MLWNQWSSALITVSMEHSSCGLVHALWVHTCKHKQLNTRHCSDDHEEDGKDLGPKGLTQACGWLQVVATGTAYQLVQEGIGAQVCTHKVHAWDRLQINMNTYHEQNQHEQQQLAVHMLHRRLIHSIASLPRPDCTAELCAKCWSIPISSTIASVAIARIKSTIEGPPSPTPGKEAPAPWRTPTSAPAPLFHSRDIMPLWVDLM